MPRYLHRFGENARKDKVRKHRHLLTRIGRRSSLVGFRDPFSTLEWHRQQSVVDISWQWYGYFGSAMLRMCLSKSRILGKLLAEYRGQSWEDGLVTRPLILSLPKFAMPPFMIPLRSMYRARSQSCGSRSASLIWYHLMVLLGTPARPSLAPPTGTALSCRLNHSAEIMLPGKS